MKSYCAQSVRDEKLLCAECAGVPKLTAHKYSENDVGSQLILCILSFLEYDIDE